MPVRFVTRWISLLALITSSLLHPPAIALAQSTAYQTVVVTDDSGAQTSFTAPPQRVVSLAYLVHPDRFAASGGPHLSPIDGVRPYCAPGQIDELAVEPVRPGRERLGLV